MQDSVRFNILVYDSIGIVNSYAISSRSDTDVAYADDADVSRTNEYHCAIRHAFMWLHVKEELNSETQK